MFSNQNCWCCFSHFTDADHEVHGCFFAGLVALLKHISSLSLCRQGNNSSGKRPELCCVVWIKTYFEEMWQWSANFRTSCTDQVNKPLEKKIMRWVIHKPALYLWLLYVSFWCRCKVSSFYWILDLLNKFGFKGVVCHFRGFFCLCDEFRLHSQVIHFPTINPTITNA